MVTRRGDGYRCAPPILRAISLQTAGSIGEDVTHDKLFCRRFPHRNEAVEPDQSDLPAMANQIRAFGLRQIDPTGKSLLIFRNRVKPRNQKYFCFRLTQISSLIRTVPSRKRGVAHVTNVGRDAVDAAGTSDE